MKKIYPPKLKKRDEIRVIAPSRSLTLVSKETKKIAIDRLENLGLKVTFGKNCKESDVFKSSSIKSRIEDLHEAFADKNVKMVLTVIGGFNSNQLLDQINFNLIKRNPKIFCGFSDITILLNSIFVKTGLVTYHGPHFSAFGMKKGFSYSEKYFIKGVMEENKTLPVKPSKQWSDDRWYNDQKKRKFIKNSGYKMIQKGSCAGRIIGGNLCTLNLLQGTEFMPFLKDTVLFIEDDDLAAEYFPEEFDRNLQSLLQQLGANTIRGIVFGRFQKKSNMTMEKLKKIVQTKNKLKGLPIIANADFGHTTPQFTFPIGGIAKMRVGKEKVSLEIIAE